jgi:hypothetical protein
MGWRAILCGVQYGGIGLYFLIVQKCVVEVIVPFMTVYMILMLPHLTSLSYQFTHDNDGADVPDEYSTPASALGKLFAMSLAGMEWDDFLLGEQSREWAISSGVMIIYTVIVYVLLLNLLIAELGDRITDIKDKAKPQVQ